MGLSVKAQMRSREERRLATSPADSLAGAHVLFVTDTQLHCLGLSKLLPSTVYLNSADTTEKALQQIECKPPGAVLVDLTMEDAVHAAQRIAARFPGNRILALSMSEREDEVLALARAGISAYLPRGASMEDFHGALAKTIRGEAVFPQELLHRLIAGLVRDAHTGTTGGAHSFSERELQVASFVMERLTNHEISERLCIGEGTVKTHVHNLLAKTGTSSRRELASWIRQRHLTWYSDTSDQKI